MSDIYTTYDKNLYRQGSAVYAKTPSQLTISNLGTVNTQQAPLQTTAPAEMTYGFLKSTNYKTGVSGWIIQSGGNVEFGSGYFRGTIIATAGTIGGFDIGSDYIRDTANSFGLASTVTAGDDVRFWAGQTFANRATAPFRITEAGALTSTSGSIAGWTISSTSISKTNIVIDSANDRITCGGTNTILDGTGITAIAGSIGGWDITSTLLRSATSGVRIELDKSKNRISIFDSTNEKVVMGYLDGLAKHDGTGNWGASNYGFWARTGDYLSIDGDSEYVSGDWIVKNDANYLINDGSDNTIIRLGTDSGEKGLFIYDTSATQLAKFISDEIYVGDATDYLKYTTTDGLEISGKFNIGGTTITISSGDNIQNAIDLVFAAGGGTVYLQPGTYILTSDISIPSGCTLEGVSRDEVILDCDETYAVKIVGTDVYSTGTVTINNGDTTLEGSGTTWTSEMVGQYVLLDGLWYEIIARTDNDTITISTYEGDDLSGASYVIATPVFNTYLRKLSITGATGSGLIISYSQEPYIYDVVLYGNGTGINADYVTYLQLNSITSTGNGVNLDMSYVEGFYIDWSDFSYSTVGAGVIIDNYTRNSTFFNTSVADNTGNGISITKARKIACISLDVSGNGGKGIEFISNNSDNSISDTTFDGNASDGIKLTATTDNTQIIGVGVLNSGGYGINIAASTNDNNQIVSTVFDNNSSGNLNDSGTNTQITRNLRTRVSTETSSATPTINTNNVDAHSITALATNITSFTTNLSGTPTNFQKLIIRIKDDGTARTIAWGASFETRGVALPTTTVISKVLTVGFIYDTITSKWGCVASAQE